MVFESYNNKTVRKSGIKFQKTDFLPLALKLKSYKRNKTGKIKYYILID